jgi:hypothetical protein
MRPLNPTHGRIHKRFEFLDPIQDSLELHPVPFSLTDGGFATSIFSESGTGCAILAVSSFASVAQNPFLNHSYPQILLKTHKKDVVLLRNVRWVTQKALTHPSQLK